MCGIFGCWLRRPLGEGDLAGARRAVAALGHRGPDGQGEWFDAQAGIYLGHRRLAIVDLTEASGQPMLRGLAAVVFNGELYNFLELKSELEAVGERFSTTGDTEVLLAAWRRWGIASLDRMDGMFAFAIFDGGELHLVTDPFGEKPLFIAENDEGIYFASEAQVLVDLLQLKFEPSPLQVAQFLALGYMPMPDTGYPGLKALQPGSVMVRNASGQSRTARYWEPPPCSTGSGAVRITEGDLDELAGILIRLLRRRIHADVPVGLYLSSGVDSALIAALAARELKVELQTLTVGFADGVDETQQAGAIAAALGLPHRTIDSRANELWRDLPTALAGLFGVPNDNVTAISIEQMSRVARQSMKVALGGIGGDEVFFGYNKYDYLYRQRWLYRIPGTAYTLARPPRQVLDHLPRFQRAFELLGGSDVTRFLTLKNPAWRRSLADSGLSVPGLPDLDSCRRDLVYAARDFDVRQTMPASYIAAVDRGSMRVGVEVRTPYLARELYAFVSRFDPATLIRDGKKSMLRRILRRYLPPAITEAPKRGFVFPLRRYFETTPEAAPALGGLPLDIPAQAIWARRSSPGYDTLALRLAILSRFVGTQSGSHAGS